jgi:hypothetical protein
MLHHYRYDNGHYDGYHRDMHHGHDGHHHGNDRYDGYYDRYDNGYDGYFRHQHHAHCRYHRHDHRGVTSTTGNGEDQAKVCVLRHKHNGKHYHRVWDVEDLHLGDKVVKEVLPRGYDGDRDLNATGGANGGDPCCENSGF